MKFYHHFYRSIAKTGAYITQEEADEIITVNQMRNGGCCGGDGCC